VRLDAGADIGSGASSQSGSRARVTAVADVRKAA
jgi:hypothetical protein